MHTTATATRSTKRGAGLVRGPCLFLPATAVSQMPGCWLVLAGLAMALCQASLAQEAPGLALEPLRPRQSGDAFQNVRIFDGRSATLSPPSNVLVQRQHHRAHFAEPDVEADAGVRVIAADGRVLMPGLIDAHWHAFMAATPSRC